MNRQDLILKKLLWVAMERAGKQLMEVGQLFIQVVRLLRIMILA
jgi:hypothetical protein